MDDIDICIISPWLLEAGTKRGGGREEIDYQVALELSKEYSVILLSTYYKKYVGNIFINDNLSIKEVYFPATRDYPPKSRIDEFKIWLIIPIFSLLIALNLIFLKRRKLKLIIVHSGTPGLFSATIARFLKLVVLYLEGNTIPWVNPYIFEAGTMNVYPSYTDRLLAKLSDFIITQSNFIKDGMINDKVDPMKIDVIPAGVDLDLFKPSFCNWNANSITIGFIGRLTEEKGARLLKEIIECALLRIPEVKFLIMGDGPYKDKLLGASNIIHLGWIKRDELNSWLSKVQIVIFLQKDLGLAELEALSAGKVIVACNLGAVPYTINHLRNGYLSEPNAESFIEAINSLLRNPELMKSLSRNARSTAVNFFDWNIIGKKWRSCCKRAIKDDRKNL